MHKHAVAPCARAQHKLTQKKDQKEKKQPRILLDTLRFGIQNACKPYAEGKGGKRYIDVMYVLSNLIVGLKLVCMCSFMTNGDQDVKPRERKGGRRDART